MPFGASNMSIGISIYLRDQFSGTSGNVRNQMSQLNNEARRMQEQQLRIQRNLNAAGAAVGIGALNQMAKWIKTGSEFGYTMKYVSSIAEEQGIKYDQLSTKAKKLGQSTMFTAIDVASGMRFMAMAGQNTEQIYNNITAAVNLAGSTMTELGGKGGAADILTNVMKGFQIESTLQNSTRAADVLTTATTSANVSLFDLGEALKYSTSTAKDLNITLEETAAMIMMAGDAGIQGSMAGTAIENMLRYITKAAGFAGSEKQKVALGMLGLTKADLQDAQGNLLPISQLLHKMAGNIQGMGTVQAQNVMAQLFGVRGKREASLLLRSMGDYDQFLKKLNESAGGSSARIMSGMMGTLEGNTLQMASAWDTAKIAFTEALEPVLIPLLKVLTGVLKGISAIMSTKFGAFLTVVGVGFIAIKTAGMAYRAVQAGIRLLNLQMSSTFTQTSNSTVAGYGRMTAAATAYGRAAGMANVMGGAGSMMGGGMAGAGLFGMGARKGVFKTGQLYRNVKGQFISRPEAMRQMYGRPLGWAATKAGGISRTIGSRFTGAGPTLGKVGGLFKGGGLGIGLAGMGLQMAGEYVGGTTGKALGVAGTTASYAGTGAMIGSIIPGLGTAIGGLVGGVIGLGAGIWDWVSSNDDNTDALKENSKSQAEVNKSLLSQDPKSFWASRLNIMKADKALPSGTFTEEYRDEEYGRFRTPGGGMYEGTPQARYTSPTHIVFNVDGEQKFNDVFDDKQRSINYEVGL